MAEIAGHVQLPTAVVRSALERLATEGLVTLHDGYRLYSVGTMTPTERAHRMMRTAIHRGYEPGECFMNRDEIARTFQIGTKEAAAAVRRLVAEGLLAGHAASTSTRTARSSSADASGSSGSGRATCAARPSN
ncbi:hypothetical protein [Streptomyces caatingaensis]|uniref:hypothetical protein n=1 Tax=Streptomyces caatingaensis TaxID=1678637 RepID=UPI001F5285EF|nr:hypothetical protein [Streptomyces caatingaensis]